MPEFNELIERRNQREGTYGYNRWHRLDIMVRASDLEWTAGLPNEQAARNELAMVVDLVADVDYGDDDPALLRRLATAIALRIEYLEPEAHNPEG